MSPQVTKQTWLTLDPDVRQKLRETFAIGKSEPTHVSGGVLVSDGTSNKDLESLSVGKMVVFLGDRLPWFQDNLEQVLLNLVIQKLYGRQEEKDGDLGKSGTGEVVIEPVRTAPEEALTPRRGRPRREAKDVSVTPQAL